MKLSSLFVLLSLCAAAADKRPLVHGHRGARAVLPEGTLPAFEHAIAAGADVLELDLAVTKDNVLVVSHDSTINPVICSGPQLHAPIRQLTLQQVKQYDCGAKANPAYPKQKPVPGTRIPTLDEVLALAPRGAFEFNIETKISLDKPELAPSPEEFARLLIAAIRRHKLGSRTMVQSFDFRTLHAMKKLAPAIRRSALYNGKPRDFVDIAREADATVVSPHYTLVTKEQVDKAHAAGLQVVPWTPNEPAEWTSLIAAGVDAIITDDPASLIAFLKSRP